MYSVTKINTINCKQNFLNSVTKEVIYSTNGIENPKTMNSNFPITLGDLNYDCLREIYKHLTIEEAFATMGIFSPMADEVARDHISSTKEFYIDMRFQPEYPDELFEIIGRNIKSLFLTVGYSIECSKVLSILRPICSAAAAQSLTELTIKYICFGQGYLECILPIAPQLEVLSLCNCQLNNELLKSILEAFVKLRRLEINHNYDLTPKTIQLAKNTIPVVLYDDRHF